MESVLKQAAGETAVKFGKQVGLKMNVAKTKFMKLNYSTALPKLFAIKGEVIEEVECFFVTAVA